MKNILFFALLIFPLSAYSQDDGDSDNFSIIDGRVVWSKVFQSPEGIDVADYFISHPLFDNPVLYNDALSGATTERPFEYRKFGYKWSKTPIVFNHPAVVHYKIEIREGRYRVTVFDLIWNVNTGALTSSEFILSDLALNRNNEYTKLFVNSMSELTNLCLLDLFEIKDVTGGGDW